MIPSYYDNPAARARLSVAAQQLVGTPFFANSEAPGRDGGIDCVRALNWVYRTTGAIGPVEIPHQEMDHGAHSDHSILIEALETWPELRERFACVWCCAAASPDPVVVADPRPGDCLCFRAGRVPHHGGLMLPGGDFLQVLKGPGVHTMQLRAAIRGWRVLGYLAAVYRPLPL